MVMCSMPARWQASSRSRPAAAAAEAIHEAQRVAAAAGRHIIFIASVCGTEADPQSLSRQAATLREAGETARVVTQLAPAWTTDWITTEAREKLRAYGIAPPVHAATVNIVRRAKAQPVPCPRCGSMNTTETSAFGSTACKALHRCLDCLEPFDHFKPY